MKKVIYLKKLEGGLKGLPSNEIKDILFDYNEYFSEGLKKKRNEEDIAKGLGDPEKVAKNLKAEYYVSAAKEKSSFNNVLKAVIASMGLGLFNLIIVLGPLIGLFAILLGLYVVVISLWATGLLIFAISIISLGLNFLLGMGLLTGSIAIIALGIIFFVGVNYLSKYFLKGLAAYYKLNVRIIRGEKK
jgi:uncharacterized membrane protein